MRILIVTNERANVPGVEQYGYHRALCDLGHETEIFYYRKKSFAYSNFRRAWVHRMNKRLVERVRDWKADLLLVFRGGYVSAETVHTVNRKTSCVTVNFYNDNPWGLAGVYPPLPFEVIQAYRLFLTKDRYFERELRAQGIDHVRYLPHGYDPAYFRPPDLSEEDRRRFGADVSFVGSPYPFRVALMDGIVGPKVDLRIWGKGRWKDVKSDWIRERYQGVLPNEDKVRVYAASRINLNPQHPGGGVFSLEDRSISIAGSGGFQLTNHKEDIGEFFTPGEEIATYRDRADLRRLIEYHVSHPDETAEMSRKAMERALRDHTHRRRVETLLEMLGGSG